MEQFGLAGDVLRKVNPRLVFARMPAFGARRAVAGTRRVRPHDGTDRRPGLGDRPAGGAAGRTRGACDPLAGVHAAFAVLAALNFAERTGTGQLVELPMLETVLNATAIQAIESEVFAVTLSRRGNRGHSAADPEHLPVRRIGTTGSRSPFATTRNGRRWWT